MYFNFGNLQKIENAHQRLSHKQCKCYYYIIQFSILSNHGHVFISFFTSLYSTQQPSLQLENVTCYVQNHPPDGGMQDVNAVYSTLWGSEAEQPEYMNMAFNKCKNQKVSPERPPLPTENLHTINQNSQERMHITEQM